MATAHHLLDKDGDDDIPSEWKTLGWKHVEPAQPAPTEHDLARKFAADAHARILQPPAGAAQTNPAGAANPANADESIQMLVKSAASIIQTNNEHQKEANEKRAANNAMKTVRTAQFQRLSATTFDAPGELTETMKTIINTKGQHVIHDFVKSTMAIAGRPIDFAHSASLGLSRGRITRDSPNVPNNLSLFNTPSPSVADDKVALEKQAAQIFLQAQHGKNLDAAQVELLSKSKPSIPLDVHLFVEQLCNFATLIGELFGRGLFHGYLSALESWCRRNTLILHQRHHDDHHFLSLIHI